MKCSFRWLILYNYSTMHGAKHKISEVATGNSKQPINLAVSFLL